MTAIRPLRLLRAIAVFAACLVLAACQHRPAAEAAQPLRHARQLVLVTTADWDSSQGTLRAYARDSAGGWQPAQAATPVAVGRSGSAWGLGLHGPQPGPTKREGDGRAPAGAFALGTAFGYAGDVATALPYQAMERDDWCIDVPASPLYNRIVDARNVGAQAVAGSTEPMRRDLHADGDQRYKLGFVIEHNAQGQQGAGSCIFAHLWKAPGEATAGCTAMPEPAMQALLAWLDPDAHPVLVLLPDAEYARLQAAWQLPPRP